MTKKSFSSADETRTPDKTVVETVDLTNGIKVARITLEPGWQWTQCIRPVVGTEICQARHIGAVVSGRAHLRHDDGTEVDLGPGDAYVIEPAHDAWVTGESPFVCVEFETITAATYGWSGFEH
jgi:hypothetical protein